MTCRCDAHEAVEKHKREQGPALLVYAGIFLLLGWLGQAYCRETPVCLPALVVPQ